MKSTVNKKDKTKIQMNKKVKELLSQLSSLEIRQEGVIHGLTEVEEELPLF